MTDTLNLGELRTIRAALSRLPDGNAALDLATYLGLWTTDSHSAPVARKAFKARISDLTADQLSDEMGYWTSEVGRLTEVAGAIAGQRELLKMRVKSAHAAARVRARRSLEDRASEAGAAETPEGAPARPARTPARLTQAQINDEAERDPALTDLDTQLGLIELLAAQSRAALEATTQYVTTLSREISWRTARLGSRSF